MASLAEVVEFLDGELKTNSIQDYPGAMNGLQLANEGRIERVVAAVDASLRVIEAAADGPPGLLIVHHGIFWQGTQRITGAFYRKLKVAIDNGLAIYSSHLPLDVHPKFGNNILLAQAIGLRGIEPFLEQRGLSIGLRGEWDGSREDLLGAISRAVGGNVHLCPGGAERVKKIGIITGGAGSEVARVAEQGLDTFITGEGPHWSFSLAQELGLNVLYAGHYATETFGVRRLSEEVATRFLTSWGFLNFPTGL